MTALATCPYPGCLTTIPLDGRQGCHYHRDTPRTVMMSPSLLVRPCVCGGVIDARAQRVATAVDRHQVTSRHMVWALGLPLALRRVSA